jgi:hypothetical protein
VRGSGTHWIGQRGDDSWWWGYDARPQQLEGTMYQPPVISPEAGYLARVISDGGGAMLVGSDTEAYDAGEVSIPPLVLDLWGQAFMGRAEALATRLSAD